MRILLIDDDRSLREVLHEALKLIGHQVRSSASGVEALALLRNEGLPELILLDQMMPEMSGIEFLAQIEKDSKLRNIPVVLMTGLNHVQSGTLPVLKKPFSLEELEALLQKYKTRCAG